MGAQFLQQQQKPVWKSMKLLGLQRNINETARLNEDEFRVLVLTSRKLYSAYSF